MKFIIFLCSGKDKDIIFVASSVKYLTFIRFAVFRVHEYRFHDYILTIIFQPRFLFYSQLNIHCFLL